MSPVSIPARTAQSLRALGDARRRPQGALSFRGDTACDGAVWDQGRIDARHREVIPLSRPRTKRHGLRPRLPTARPDGVDEVVRRARRGAAAAGHLGRGLDADQ